VNSPSGHSRSVGGIPRFFHARRGAWLWDADGKRYIDYVGSWGPALVGHAHPAVVGRSRSGRPSTIVGARPSSKSSSRNLLCELLPSLELVRWSARAPEATMTAIRSRAIYGTQPDIKSRGCYHGHADSLLVKAGSGALTFGQPSSAGVPRDVVAHTLVCASGIRVSRR